MRTILKSSKCIVPMMVILLFVMKSSTVFAQSESEALIIIQQADDKLIEVFKLLEDASGTNIVLRDLVQDTDNARYQIEEAKTLYSVGNYTQAYQTANDAIEELDGVLLKIDQRMNQRKQNSRILYSVLGVLAAIFTVLFVFVFIRRIQPWFKAKQLEEYGKLEIKYEIEEKEVGEDK